MIFKLSTGKQNLFTIILREQALINNTKVELSKVNITDLLREKNWTRAFNFFRYCQVLSFWKILKKNKIYEKFNLSSHQIF